MDACVAHKEYRRQLFDGDYRRWLETRMGVSFDDFSFSADSTRIMHVYSFTMPLERDGDGFILDMGNFSIVR